MEKRKNTRNQKKITEYFKKPKNGLEDQKLKNGVRGQKLRNGVEDQELKNGVKDQNQDWIEETILKSEEFQEFLQDEAFENEAQTEAQIEAHNQSQNAQNYQFPGF